MKNKGRSEKEACFRLLNCVLSGLLGLFAWLFVRLFALNSLDWLICFTSGPLLLHGLIGSSLYLLNMGSDRKE